MKQLAKFLYKIDAQKPINLIVFYALLEKLGIRHEPDMVRATKVGNNHRVTFMETSLRSTLDQLVEDTTKVENGTTKLSGRAQAARQNRSHQSKVAGSLLVIRKSIDHPQVVIFNGDGDSTEWERADTLLLIENRENFINIENTMAFVRDETPAHLPANCDVALADGNQINNSNHKDFLADYGQIYGLFDLDVGGLTIARSLVSLVPDVPFQFLMPDAIDAYLNRVATEEPQDQLDKVEGIASGCTAIHAAATKILITRRTLEQEAYLI